MAQHATQDGAQLTLAQMQVDLRRAQAHAATVLGWSHRPLSDQGLVIKTLLTEALNGPRLRPWRLERLHNGIATVLGYSDADENTLAASLSAALPSVQAALSLAGTMAVSPQQSTVYPFSLRLCPTIHVTPGQGKRHGERDAFLVAIESNPDQPQDRLLVYAHYLASRLKGAELLSSEMLQGTQLKPMFRPKSDRKLARKTLPDASMAGTLRVTDAGAFANTIRSGIGRQRAYGFGMLRLGAPR